LLRADEARGVFGIVARTDRCAHVAPEAVRAPTARHGTEPDRDAEDARRWGASG
jgi:hypothetical protein